MRLKLYEEGPEHGFGIDQPMLPIIVLPTSILGSRNDVKTRKNQWNAGTGTGKKTPSGQQGE